MLTVLLANTWKAPRLKGLDGLILQQNEQLLLSYLMGIYVSDEASFATKAAVLKTINDIKDLATLQSKQAGNNKGYWLMTLERIENRYKAKAFVPEPMPPGAPIGCDMD
jgi:hypothetical protein